MSTSATHPDISAKFAENIKPRRGRPKSLRRQAVRMVAEGPLSERSVGNRVAAMRVAEAIGKIDPGLYEWLYTRRVTAVYALGRLPLHAILQIARELREEGPMSAQEAVLLIRIIRGSLIAEARCAARAVSAP